VCQNLHCGEEVTCETRARHVTDGGAAAMTAVGAEVRRLRAVAVRRGILRVRFKWPNDVYAAGQHLGGVLCGSTHADGFFRVTVGVGLNMTNVTPSICLQAMLKAAATASCGCAAATGAAPRAPDGRHSGRVRGTGDAFRGGRWLRRPFG
jgi:biotin-(acetyl-CoA carboxylase) ligase